MTDAPSPLPPPARGGPLPRIEGVIADLDGVVYRGEAPIPGAVEAFARWRTAGVPYAFVTNNATRTPAAFADKLSRLGVACTPAQVITSPLAAAAHMRAHWPAGTPVLVVGAPALAEAVRDAGLSVSDEGAKIVVVGLDRDFTYARLRAATRALHAGATLIGTNADRMLPTEDGFDPGAGSILAAVAAGGCATPTVLGKPEPAMLDMALAHIGTPRAGTVMIGDQPSTDIVAGQRAGLRTILVTTGVPGDGAATPDHVVDNLLDLFG